MSFSCPLRFYLSISPNPLKTALEKLIETQKQEIAQALTEKTESEQLLAETKNIFVEQRMQAAREAEQLRGELQSKTQSLAALEASAKQQRDKSQAEYKTLRESFEAEHTRRQRAEKELEDARRQLQQEVQQLQSQLVQLQDRCATSETAAHEASRRAAAMEDERKRMQSQCESAWEMRRRFIYLFSSKLCI